MERRGFGHAVFMACWAGDEKFCGHWEKSPLPLEHPPEIWYNIAISGCSGGEPPS
jgi:hypothetical protein